MSLKMRRVLATRASTDHTRREIIHEFLPAFVNALKTMLRLSGESAVKDKKEVLDKAAHIWGLSRTVLESLARVHWDGDSSEDTEKLAFGFLDDVVKAGAVVDQMEE